MDARRAHVPQHPGTTESNQTATASRLTSKAPFPAVRALLLPPQAPHKTLQKAISCFSAIHGRLHREQAVIRIHTAVTHGLFTTYPQVPECQPENTTTAGAECPVLCSH